MPDPLLPPDLTRALAAGDAAAFEQLFDAYRDRLCRYVAGYLRSWESAEDVVGELFLQLWRDRARLAEVRDLDAYLYTLARRDAHDSLRHRAVERRWQEHRGTSAGATPVTVLPVGEHRLIAEETSAALSRALDSLPERQREILRRRMGEESHREIAEHLGIDPRTVETHLRRAFARLRELLPRLRD